MNNSKIQRYTNLKKQALDIINLSLHKHDNPVIAFSGGKDSTAILTLIRSINPNIPAVFCDTGVEAKETYEYIKSIDNVIITKGEKTFWQIVEKVGMPGTKGDNNGHAHINPCCEILKDRPMKEAIKTHGWGLIFDGLTMAESWQRRMFLKHYGPLHKVKTWGNVWKCHPIYDWTEEDVWYYIKTENILYNKIYDPPRNAKRCGCQPCTAYLSWEDRLRAENPKLYKLVATKKKGNYTPPIFDYAYEADREDCPP